MLKNIFKGMYPNSILPFANIIFTHIDNWAKWVFYLNFVFYIGVSPMNNIVIVSGKQQRDSAIHMHVSILPQTPLPSRLPHDVEQSSLCNTVGPCWWSILNAAVHTCPSHTP